MNILRICMLLAAANCAQFDWLEEHRHHGRRRLSHVCSVTGVLELCCKTDMSRCKYCTGNSNCLTGATGGVDDCPNQSGCSSNVDCDGTLSNLAYTFSSVTKTRNTGTVQISTTWTDKFSTSQPVVCNVYECRMSRSSGVNIDSSFSTIATYISNVGEITMDSDTWTVAGTAVYEFQCRGGKDWVSHSSTLTVTVRDSCDTPTVITS